MFAVMKTGGKQYKVASGDVLRVEKIAATAGETVQFNEVLMVGTTVGTPTVTGAGVQAEIIDQIKGEKVIHFVKRRRKHSSKRTKGHRQQLTLLRITDILEKGADKSGVKEAVGVGSVSLAALATMDLAASNKPILQKNAKKADKPAAKKPAAKKAEPKATKAEATVADTAGKKPTNLLTEAREGGADDLKKISGVGPKLEGVLHSAGVFHFDQIAAWGPTEVEYMDDKLSFKGRIDRDEWIKQANEFMKG
jgi:large subunit ribosomal protein L21